MPTPLNLRGVMLNQGANPSNPSAVLAVLLRGFSVRELGLWIFIRFEINIGDNGSPTRRCNDVPVIPCLNNSFRAP